MQRCENNADLDSIMCCYNETLVSFLLFPFQCKKINLTYHILFFVINSILCALNDCSFYCSIFILFVVRVSLPNRRSNVVTLKIVQRSLFYHISMTIKTIMVHTKLFLVIHKIIVVFVIVCRLETMSHYKMKITRTIIKHL